MSIEPSNSSFYVGEFRYVFYSPYEKYEPTIAFYRDVLGFPIVGGFSYGKYFQASTGILEVIQDKGSGDLRSMLLEPSQEYEPPRGGFLLIEVEDLEAIRRRVEGAGIPLMQEPRDWEWRFRDFKVRDPCRNMLCFFCRLPGWEEHHAIPAA